MIDQPDWLLWAWRELGVREVRGSTDNERIVDMFKEVGHPAIKNDEVAWCAAFLGACLERAGQRSTRSLMARSYLKWGAPAGAPRLGSIAVLSRGSDPALGHVGFVVGETDLHIYLLGGNQSDAVSVAAFDKSRVLDYRLPVTAVASIEAPVVEGVHAVQQKPKLGDSSLFGSGLAHVLAMEGGFTDDAHDPGGPTNKGITLSVYARWVGETISERTRAGLVRRLKQIPDAMVREIYATRYWGPAGCARMPPELAIFHFDTAVNHGVGRAIRLLQQSVGAAVDGEIGPETRSRIAAKPLNELLVAYADARREHYRSLSHFWRFGRGWLRRVDFSLLAAAGTARASPEVLATDVADVESEDEVEALDDQKKGTDSMTDDDTHPDAQAKWWGESMTIWGVLVTAASTVLPVLGPLIGIDITGEMVRQIGAQVTEVVQALGGVVGTLLAIAGRVRATQPIARRLVSLKL